MNGGAVSDIILTPYNSFKYNKYNPNVRLPARLIARMLHQVFSSLQHLYTVYDRPIFHKDLHSGNIWLDFKPAKNGELSDVPDFYLGDFGYAMWNYNYTTHHIATRDVDRVMEWARLMICVNLPENQRPPKDCKIPNPDDPDRGKIPGDAPMTAVLSLYYDLCDELNFFKEENSRFLTKPLCPPPDLMNMIRKAKRVEEQLMPASLMGAVLNVVTGMDESGDARVQMFMHDLKAGALRKARAQPLTMTGSVERCLTPMVGETPVKVHGPFYLAEIRAATGRWEAIDDRTYHRPGKTRGSGRGLRGISESPNEDEDISECEGY